MTVDQQIASILETEFTPKQLRVVNQSHLHAGHAGDDGSGESHYLIEIESDSFSTCSRVECHRMIYKALESKMETLPHALAIKAKSVK